MAYNDISKNYTYENGGTIDGDLALTTMAANTKIKNKASGELYVKRSGYTNVFDKTNTLADYLKATDLTINSSGSGNGVASITYSSSDRKITQNLTTFTTPSDLATANDNLKSQAVGSISVSGRTVTYKNVNGQDLGSFQTQDNNTTYSAGTGLSLSGTTFNVTSTAGNSNLQWNTEITLGTVGGLAIKAKMPALTSSDITNALGYTPAREGSGGGSYQAWYVEGDSLQNPYSSSDIYSMITSYSAGGSGQGPSTTTYSLGGSNPIDGTYNCTLLSVEERQNYASNSSPQFTTVYFMRVSITKIA